MPALNGNVREHVVREMREEIHHMASEGLHQGGFIRGTFEKSSVKILLGQRVAEGVNDSRALAATVVYDMPVDVREFEVREFLGWIQGSNGLLVTEYLRAATIRPSARMGELSGFQRAALIGALRFRRRIER
jgi:hypothetical protein